MIDYRIKKEAIAGSRKFFLAYQHMGKIYARRVDEKTLDRHWNKVTDFTHTGHGRDLLVCFNNTIVYKENQHLACRAAKIADLNDYHWYSLIPRNR